MMTAAYRYKVKKEAGAYEHLHHGKPWTNTVYGKIKFRKRFIQAVCGIVSRGAYVI